MPSTASLLARFGMSLLFIREASSSPESVWHASIFEGPAPPPGKGSPLQASALRNKSYLPAQIASIVAAYVLSLLFIGSALLFVGRRLRRAAQSSPISLAMEMVKPTKPKFNNALDPSPISPATSKNVYGPSPAETFDMKNNWPSPDKSKRESVGWSSTQRGHTRRQPSYQSSVVTFDESVIEEDKERNEREMERLYAAVAEHDEKKSSVTDFSGPGQSVRAPELQHLRDARPIQSAPSRTDTNSPPQVPPKSPRMVQRPTPLSLHSRNSSRSSFGSFGKKRGIRNLPISPPMGSPDLVPDAAYSESEPLSPRHYYDPGPPPPTPPQKRHDVAREERMSPREARFPDHPLRTPRMPAPIIPTIHEPIPETRPAEWPSRDDSKPSLARDPNKAKRTPAPLSLRMPTANNPSLAPSTNPTLRTAPLPLRNPYPTNLNSDRQDTIKATVLETKARNQTLRTPGTGVPMTPYSPYMPYTPLTPMTPSRLVTREERKRRVKEDSRRVITEEDAVLEEADAWGDV